MLEVFACAIKYTLQQNFLLSLLYRWMIIYLTDFHVIGHLFSSKILNVSNNSMMDDFEHKFHKWFLIPDYFICMEKILPPISPSPFFNAFFFPMCSDFSRLLFSISKIFQHDDEMFHPLRLFMKFRLVLCSSKFSARLHFPEMNKSKCFILTYKFAFILRYRW